MQQLINPNPNIPCKPGWCLQYVRQTFGLAGVYPSATAGWAASNTKHRDQNFPSGVWLPLWFFMANEPLGHVVLRAPNGSIYSTTDLSTTPRHHPNLTDLMRIYAGAGLPLTYLGWTEDIEGVAVVDGSYSLTPAGTINPSQEDDMPITDDDAVKIARVLLNYNLDRAGDGQSGSVNLGAVLSWYDANIAATVQNTASEVLNRNLPWAGFDGSGRSGDRTATTLAGQTAWLDAQHVALSNAVAGLTELVKQLSVAQGVTIDYKAIAKAVNDDAAKRLSA